MSKLSTRIVLMIKKAGISVLSSDMVAGTIRKIYKNKIPHYTRTVYTDSPLISNRVVGNIFFKAYEKSEITYVKKYLYTDIPVVELGCSIGVMAMQLTARTSRPVFSVEANPALIPVIQNNLEKNDIKNCTVFNYIIATSDEQFYFVNGNDNTTGHVTVTPEPNAVKVSSLSLSSFLTENKINDYVLVCDIEGAEIYILKEDINSLKNCRQIIIELHDTHYGDVPVKIETMEKIILDNGFRLQDGYGANKVFVRI